MMWVPFLMDIFPVFMFTAMMLYAESVLELPLHHVPSLMFQEYLEIRVPTFYQCLELCVVFRLCRHLQFEENSSKCLLNSDEHDRQDIWQTSLNKKSVKKTSIPQDIGGACRGHACAIDEMCVQAGQAYICVKHGYTTMKCPIQWAHRGDMCFMVSMDKKTWKEAKDFCASTGAELLTFETTPEMYDYTYVIYFRALSLGRRGKIWTGLDYSKNLPSWMMIKPPTANVSDPCIGWVFNRTEVGTGSYNTRSYEAIDCNEKNGFACQHRSPDYWS